MAEITVEDVLHIVRNVKQRAPSHARNLLGYVRRFFDWAIEQHAYGIKVNPCVGLKPARIVGEKIARDRVLNDEELFAFWRATGHIGYPFGPLYRLLILTGLRLNEVADATWSEIDFRNGIWIVPAARMKGKDGRAVDHVVPLTADIMAILESLPRFKSGDCLFSVTFGRTPVWVSDKVKKRVDARMLRTLRAMARRLGDDPAETAVVVHQPRTRSRLHAERSGWQALHSLKPARIARRAGFLSWLLVTGLRAPTARVRAACR